MSKKLSSLIVLAILLVPAAMTMVGCDGETKADPKIIEARDKQRMATQPGGGGQPQPGGQPAPGGN